MAELKILLSDYTFQTVSIGSAILGIISGILGSLAVLRKQGLLGEGISHCALPGVVIAFILTGTKNTELLLFGAFISGLFSVLLISIIVKNSPIRFDSSLALVMSVLFGFGIVLLTYVQKLPNANQAGLSRFIYGQASTMLIRDVYIMSACCILLFLIVMLCWKEFKLFIFDPSLAQLLGFRNTIMNLMLSFMLVMVIIIGIQTVGVVLMSAMLITPAAAARQWSSKMWTMTLLSALFGCISGVTGTIISSLIPKVPTGATIVLIVSIISIFSLLFAPKRGIIHKIYKRRRHKSLLLAVKE